MTTTALGTGTLDGLGGDVDVPRYDRSALTPAVVHVGVGGFHRAHLARYLDEVARTGDTGWGIVGVGVLEFDAAMAEALQPQDGLYTLVERDQGGTSVRVVGSLVRYVHAHPDRTPLAELVAAPTTRIVSLTITEGGYPVDDAGAFTRDRPGTEGGAVFDVLVDGLAARRDAGSGPVTFLSCDNVQGNGDVTRSAVQGALAAREDPALTAWVEEHVTFPNSMVDRITPATTDEDRRWLREEHGIDDAWPVFAEPFTQWVVEDDFAAGRPPLEDHGVVLTDDVAPYEACKLQLLNAAHTVLAYPGRLLGHRWVHAVLADERVAGFLRRYLDEEAGPVVPRVPGIDIEEYEDTLLRRFANPAIADQVDRLCQDGSAKVPTFVLPTVRAQLARGGSVRLGAAAIAAWCEYLLGEEEDGTPIDVAPDPDLATVRAAAEASREDPAAFLDVRSVFGRDLADDPTFTAAFSAALELLRSEGIASTLSAAADTADADTAAETD